MSAIRREHAAEPRPATENFVGRGPELDKISTLLQSPARLITLVGSGGIGKTRLATEALRRFGRAGHDRVYWARLARLSKGSEKSSVAEEIAASVVGAGYSGKSARAALVAKLAEPDIAGRTVLVLDNCEHVLEATGHLIAELLDETTGLTILATSREAIGWVDEHVIVVPPLTRKQALALFRERAELADRPIADSDQRAVANRICHRVHYHPLYIRLAAARLLHRPLEVVLQELSGETADRRMRWPHVPRAGAEPRHRRVRDVIAWSYDLCQEKERILLARMSVFAAGYDTNAEDDSCPTLDVGVDVEAIQEICADDPSAARTWHGEPAAILTAEEIEGLLERLVDQSLVTLHIAPTTVRYSLLESIRLFAEEELENRPGDEPARFARRHRQYYRDRVAGTQSIWFRSGSAELLGWGHAAWDNILIAIETSISSHEPEVGLQICKDLISVRAPVFKGSIREMRKWTERALRASRAQTGQITGLQLEATALIIWILLSQGLREDAERMLEQCAADCLGGASKTEGWRRSPEIDTGLPAALESVWGVELMTGHRDPRAIQVLARAREKYRELGDRAGAARSELDEAMAASFFGSASVALEITRRHLDHATASGSQWAKSWAEMAWSIALTKHGDPTESLKIARSVLSRQLPLRDQWGATMSVHIVQWSLAETITEMRESGSADEATIKALAIEAARLAGGAARMRDELDIDIDNGHFGHETQRAVEIIEQILDRDEFSFAEKQGRLLRPDHHEVQRLALGELHIDRMPLDHPARKTVPSHWHELSATEEQVAILAAAGWTNSAIADRRGNSSRTVDAHMAAVFRKLMISSRGDIIKLVPEEKIELVHRDAGRIPRRVGQQPHRSHRGR
ncbi:AAA family ATPase [Nocardia sp. NPDC003963]